MVALAERLADRHTVFAFDSPGFGESDPLDLDHIEIEDLAEAVAATMRALKMPKCAVFGTHTGACIALEVARRWSGDTASPGRSGCYRSRRLWLWSC
ncbi:MAG: alpha/beta fold hydrolase [Alphaproteobacteria bacterium]|nr:alpha/beta fold hydrolase [Alphaproteobacteria bacterium]